MVEIIDFNFYIKVAHPTVCQSNPSMYTSNAYVHSLLFMNTSVSGANDKLNWPYKVMRQIL